MILFRIWHSRRGNDWTKRFRKIAADAFAINASSAIIDGEVAVPGTKRHYRLFSVAE